MNGSTHDRPVRLSSSSRRRRVQFSVAPQQPEEDDEEDQENVPRDDEADGGGRGPSCFTTRTAATPGRRPAAARPSPPIGDDDGDELDEVDAFDPAVDDVDNDGDDGTTRVMMIRSEKELREAKRQRRLQRLPQQQSSESGSDALHQKDPTWDPDWAPDEVQAEAVTHLDRDTSLAADHYQIPLEPFSMQPERTDGQGYFEGDTYIFRKRPRGGHDDDDEEPDAWLDSLHQAGDPPGAPTLRPPKDHHHHPDKKDDDDDDNNKQEDEEENDDDDDANNNNNNNNNMDQWTTTELVAQLGPYVSPTETVLQALVRYGQLLRPKKSARPRSTAAAADGAAPKNVEGSPEKEEEATTTTLSPPPPHDWAQQALHEVTAAASALLVQGQMDIYQKTGRDLQQLLPHHEAPLEEDGVFPTGGSHHHHPDPPVPPAPTPPASTPSEVVVEKKEDPVVDEEEGRQQHQEETYWEYQGSQDGQIHGPYTTAEMQGWIQAGYFVGPAAVYVRPLRRTMPRSSGTVAAASPPSIQDDLLADLMNDDDDDDAKNDRGNPSNGISGSAHDDYDTQLIRGDWIMSDQVDFSARYLPLE